MAARVFVDTNVLSPFSVMDVMLALTEDSIHEIVWSERLLAEWERVIVREGRRSAESAAAVAQAVRRFFADCEIAAAVYGHLVDEMPVDDPDDRHHAAAAVGEKDQSMPEPTAPLTEFIRPSCSLRKGWWAGGEPPTHQSQAQARYGE